MTEDRRTPIVVVAGGPDQAQRAALTLLDATAVVVRHDLSLLAEGVIRRTLTTAVDERVRVLELAHGCVSCTLRQDLLPLLCTLSARSSVERVVLCLDQAMEPEIVCNAIAEVVVTGVVGRVDGPAGRDVRVDAVIAALDAETWLADATGDETIGERANTDDDDRTVAQVAVAQVEFADALALFGNPEPSGRATLEAVLDRLAPGAPRHWNDVAVPSVRRGVDYDPHASLLRGSPPLDADGSVRLVEFSAARPFHPERLHDAVDVLFDGVVTAHGRCWLATQPDNMLWLESAGGAMRVGLADTWLVAMTPAQLAEADPERTAVASMRWDDAYGDRHISLVVLVYDADPEVITRAFEWALLTDDELRAPWTWKHWPDPFGEWHQDPCESSDTLNAHTVEEKKNQ